MKTLAFPAVLILTLLPPALSAQRTDVYLFDRSASHRLVAQVTDRDGYDNQPAFTLDGRALLFTSDRAGGQTDILRYDIATGSVANLTDTPGTNEYSGQPMGPDHFAFVLQEGSPYQNVWYRAWEGGEIHRMLTSYVPAGYYARNDAGVFFWGRYAYAVFFEPAGAEVGPANGESLFVHGQAGTSIHAIPGENRFSFVRKRSDWSWIISAFDPETGAVTPLAPISNANEHYCWAPDGTILTAAGRKILEFRPGVDRAWREVATLEAPGFAQGGRCAVSPDGRTLAVVSTGTS